MIADLIFYKENFGGNCKIPTDEFPLWERRAEMYLSKTTGGKSETQGKNERVKMCICEIAECLYENEKNQGIVSENIDGYSAKYENGDIKKKISEIISLWLYRTDILYRGVDNESL